MTYRLLLAACLLIPAAAQADPTAPPEIEAAMKELWRRGTCLLSSVHRPAKKESAVPRKIGDTPVVEPAVRARTGAVLCYAVDGKTVWAADDQALYQADAGSGKLVKRYDRSDGLPAEPVQSIAPAGGVVWLATRSGLAKVDVVGGKIAPVAGIRFRLARLVAGAGTVWLVSDAGAYRLAGGKWTRLPGDYPNRRNIATTSRRGFWAAWWQRKQREMLPAVFANDDGLYVLAINRLARFDPATKKWARVADDCWGVRSQGRTVWAMTTTGVVRYDPASGKGRPFVTGKGPAAGRPVAMAATASAFFLASEPDYDDKAGKYTGGGISRLDTASGEWTVTERVDGVDIRFVSALADDGDDAWATCLLYEKVEQLGAHPGMAHVKRWRPVATGVGLLHCHEGEWSLLRRTGLKTEKRWIMGQKGKVQPDVVGPEIVTHVLPCGDRLWGVYRMVPKRYYAGYYLSAGLLAAKVGNDWQGRLDTRTDQLELAGEFPDLMLISHSHGRRIVMAEGHPTVLGLERIAGKAVAVCENGVFVHEPRGDKFHCVFRTAPRLYWRASAAAAGKHAVWIGGDSGTVSRFDRATGRVELVGLCPGRKVVAIGADAGKVVVRTEEIEGVLPVALRSATKLPAADTIVFDGETWTAGEGAEKIAARRPGLTTKKKSSYLYRKGRPVVFLRGAFRPKVLCADKVGGRVWLNLYSGVASIPLPE